jgi:hypothetical protein
VRSIAASAAKESSVALESAGFTGGYMLPRLSPLRHCSPRANVQSISSEIEASLNGIAVTHPQSDLYKIKPLLNGMRLSEKAASLRLR